MSVGDPGRLELPTYGLGNRRSIRLSYGTECPRWRARRDLHSRAILESPVRDEAAASRQFERVREVDKLQIGRIFSRWLRPRPRCNGTATNGRCCWFRVSPAKTGHAPLRARTLALSDEYR